MMHMPTIFKTDPLNVVLRVTSRRDKKGDIWYYVEFPDDDVRNAENMPYFRFKNMSSVLDFISSNFQ